MRFFQRRWQSATGKTLAGWLVGGLLALLLGSLSSVAASSSPLPPAQATQGQARSGVFSIVWRDARPGLNQPHQQFYLLTDDKGNSTRILLDEKLARPLGGIAKLNRKRLVITGRPVVSPNQATPPTFQAQSISLDQSRPQVAPNATISGSKPYVNILCQFADAPGFEPKPFSYFEGLLAENAPGLNHYWREASYNAINLDGSITRGWFVLPQPRSYYIVDDILQFERISQDCIATADSSVYFPAYAGINLMFNNDLDGAAWGASNYLYLDGIIQFYGMTWMPPWAYSNHGALAHEMAHGFGVPHSANFRDNEYGNYFDVVSDLWGHCPPYHTDYGCVGQHPIAFSKDLLGWIGAERKFIYKSASGAQTITLEQLAQPGPGNYLMAQVPIGSTGRYYTVEARRPVGYDKGLNRSGVIIHEVDPGRAIPARIVDADGNGVTSDDGALWTIGETFTDSANGLSITVTSATTTGYTIAIGTNPAPALTSLNPPSVIRGSADLTLAVYGAGFVPSSVVRWNGLDQPTSFISSSQLNAFISAVKLASPGAGSVSVFSPAPGGGLSNGLSFGINNPRPVVNSLNPSALPVGSTGFNLTLNGADFLDGATVYWGTAVKTPSFFSATQISFAVSTAELESSGPVSVRVVNPAPGGGDAGLSFQVNPPSITSLSRTAVAVGSDAFNLIITGNNFVNGSTVRWRKGNTTTTRTPNGVGTSQLTLPISAADLTAAGRIEIAVVNSNGTGGTSNSQFLNVYSPAISGLSPAARPVGSGPFTLTVYGTSFVAGALVRWNGVNRPTAFISSNELQAEISGSDVAMAGKPVITVLNVNSPDGVSAGQGFPLYAGCDPLVVTSPADTDTCGTLRHALNQPSSLAAPAGITLDLGNQPIVLTDPLPPVKAGVTLYGGCSTTGPLASLNASGANLADGQGLLSLDGQASINGLSLTGLNGLGLKAIAGQGKLRCLKIGR